jgi:hypothetical protein
MQPDQPYNQTVKSLLHGIDRCKPNMLVMPRYADRLIRVESR